MPTFHVYHADPPKFFLREAREAAKGFPVGYVKVATVQGDHAEDAFRATNTIDRPWMLNTDVTPSETVLIRGGARSTSVGDIIMAVEDRVPLLVADFGFEQVNPL